MGEGLFLINRKLKLRSGQSSWGKIPLTYSKRIRNVLLKNGKQNRKNGKMKALYFPLLLDQQ